MARKLILGEGYSLTPPVIDIEEVDGGHNVVVTDKNGTKSFFASNGTVDIDEIDPDTVIFPDGLTTTYAIGNVTLTNGMGTLVKPGGTLTDFFNVFIDEKNPSTTQPSISLTFAQAKAHEVGTKLTPSYSASLNPGKYTYGPATGITATAWDVIDTNGISSQERSDTFPEIQVEDDTNYKITARATYGDGTIPVTNTGNEYPAGQIKAGEATATSGAITGYRNTFYGTLTEKSDITSDIIRGLTSKSGKALTAGSSFDIAIPEGALRVIFAYPASLRDVSNVKDVNGMSAEISSGFSLQTVQVEGANGYTAIDYKVYIMDYAEANGTENTYTVTI